MSFLKDWLTRTGVKSQQEDRFSHWPRDLPLLQPIPFNLSAEPLKQEKEQATLPYAYMPAIVIGIGTVGKQVVSQWQEQLARDELSSHQNLRAIILLPSSQQPVAAPAPNTILTYEIDLTGAATNRSSAFINNDSYRVQFRTLVCENENILREFKDYLGFCINDLQRDIKVIIVGSVAEVEIGILGDLLQTLWFFAANRSPFSNITALLALEALENRLNEAETFAVLREIERFTFSDLHVFQDTQLNKRFAKDLKAKNLIVSAALLDYLFLVEASDQVPSIAEFGHGVGQAMTEALYVLLHPSSTTIWEDLLNDLKVGAEMREKYYRGVVGGVGIATLQLPVQEAQEYVAARLAYAALYGERKDLIEEGLLGSHQNIFGFQITDEFLVKRWLKNGPYFHPLFEWLLEVQRPTDLTILPQLFENLEDAFSTQLSYGLLSALNDQNQNRRFQEAVRALDWLLKHLEQLNGWFQQLSLPVTQPDQKLRFQYLLNKWLMTVKGLKEQLKRWEAVLLSKQKTTENVESTKQFIPTDWRSGVTKGQELSSNLALMLEKAQEQSKRKIEILNMGQVRRAFGSKTDHEEGEIELYYQEIVRPELVRYGVENAVAFRRVRERLGWWIQIRPKEIPQLFLVCLPPNGSRESNFNQPSESRFLPLESEIQRLYEMLLILGKIQAQGIVRDFTGSWFRKQLEKNHPFLQQAETSLLKIERQGNDEIKRRMYLIEENAIVGQEYKTIIFPKTYVAQVKEVVRSERSRLTAMGLWTNIVFSNIPTINTLRESFLDPTGLFIYDAEKNAAEYENKYRRFSRHQEWMPASALPTLTDKRLVTLFCRALFCNLIDLQPDRYNSNWIWTLSPIPNWDSLPLSEGTRENPVSLWSALRQFALKIPNDPNNPSHPFHPNNREKFLQSLETEIQKQKQTSGFLPQLQNFQATYLDKLKEMARNNPLANAFVMVLTIEQDRFQNTNN